MSHIDVMNSRPGHPMRCLREKEVNQFMETKKIFDKLFTWLFGVISFKNMPMGEALFTAHPIVIKVIVLMFVLYFILWFMGIMLPQHNGIFQIILVLIMTVIASVSSVLILTIISSLLACLGVITWIGVLALIAYCCLQEFHGLVVRAIVDATKQLIDYHRTRSTNLPVYT